MNKRQFVDALAERLGTDKRSSATALDAILDEIYALWQTVNG
jgi:nucleoid DNA-binding protein